MALISLASTFTAHSVAGTPGAGIPGRPGLNPLRHERWRVVTRNQLEVLREALADAGVGVPERGDALTVFGNRFEVGSNVGMRTGSRSGRRRSHHGRGARRQGAGRLRSGVNPRPRERPGPLDPGRLRDRVRPRSHRRRRRRLGGPRPTRAPRRGDLQGQADPLQPWRLHLPERDSAASPGRELRSLRPGSNRRSRGLQL